MYGFTIERAREQDPWQVRRYGWPFWSRRFRATRTAMKWLRRAEEEVERDPLAGVHFAPQHIRERALRDAAR